MTRTRHLQTTTAFGPGQRIGPYQLDTCLAVGAMSETWTATRITPGAAESARSVLKLLSQTRAADPRTLELFLAECNLVVDLRHPNIVAGRSKGAYDGVRYLDLVPVEGMDLADLIQLSAQPLALHHTLYILDQVLVALSFLHDPGQHGFGTPIIHRDVTPENILISCVGEVKLTDFGISQHAATERLMTSSRMGKQRYLTPEQRVGSFTDARTDLYQVGLCAIALLTRRDPEDVVVVPAGLPDPLRQWLQRLLAANPLDRFQCASDALSSLRGLKTRADDPQILGRYLVALSNRGGTQLLSEIETETNLETLEVSAPTENLQSQLASDAQPRKRMRFLHAFWILGLILLVVFGRQRYPRTLPPPSPLSTPMPTPMPMPTPIPIPELPDAGPADLAEAVSSPDLAREKHRKRPRSHQPPVSTPEPIEEMPPPPPAVKEYSPRKEWEAKHAQLVTRLTVIKDGYVAEAGKLPLLEQHEHYVALLEKVVGEYLADAEEQQVLPPRKHTCMLIHALKVLWRRRNETSWKIEIWFRGLETRQRELRTLLEDRDKDTDGKQNNSCND